MNPNDIQEANAHYDHALNYTLGQNGYEKDELKAFLHFKNAAMMGNPVAMMYLAHCYREGRGVKADDAQYRKWVKACIQSGKYPAQALHSMGIIYATDGDIEAAKRCLYQAYNRGLLPSGKEYVKLKLKDQVIFSDDHYEMSIILTECKEAKVDGTEALMADLARIPCKKRAVIH